MSKSGNSRRKKKEVVGSGGTPPSEGEWSMPIPPLPIPSPRSTSGKRASISVIPPLAVPTLTDTYASGGVGAAGAIPLEDDPVSLRGFDGTRVVTTPRSLRACRAAGISVEELLHVPLSQFQTGGTVLLRKGRGPLDIAQELYNGHEKEREIKLKLCQEQYELILSTHPVHAHHQPRPPKAPRPAATLPALTARVPVYQSQQETALVDFYLREVERLRRQEAASQKLEAKWTRAAEVGAEVAEQQAEAQRIAKQTSRDKSQNAMDSLQKRQEEVDKQVEIIKDTRATKVYEVDQRRKAKDPALQFQVQTHRRHAERVLRKFNRQEEDRQQALKDKWEKQKETLMKNLNQIQQNVDSRVAHLHVKNGKRYDRMDRLARLEEVRQEVLQERSKIHEERCVNVAVDKQKRKDGIKSVRDQMEEKRNLLAAHIAAAEGPASELEPPDWLKEAVSRVSREREEKIQELAMRRQEKVVKPLEVVEPEIPPPGEGEEKPKRKIPKPPPKPAFTHKGGVEQQINSRRYYADWMFEYFDD